MRTSSALNMSDMSTVCWMSQGRVGGASNTSVGLAHDAGEEGESDEEGDVERRYPGNNDT